MADKRLIDPELLAGLEAFPTFELNVEILPALRAMFGAPQPSTADRPVTVASVNIPGPEGAPEVRVLTYRPTNLEGTLPALLHIHGGGYIVGTPEILDAEHREMAVDLGCAIISVDYRLAPETPFPGAVEDCYAALRWLVNNAAGLGIDVNRIGLKGESAGGGLAASLALLARDRREFSFAFQHLIFPMLDDRTAAVDTPNRGVGDFLWTHAQNQFGWSALLGQQPGTPGVSPYAAAARAENLEGLPPTFISVGAIDLFLEENLEYARRLVQACVPVELHVYPGAYHGFGLTSPTARVSIAAARASREALRRGFYG